MRVREIKKEDFRVGLKVIHKGYHDPMYNDMVRTITATKNMNSSHAEAVTYDSGGWDTQESVMNHYYMIEEDKPTGIPTFDGDINKQVGGDHYSKNDPIQFAKDNYPPEHLEGFFRINVDKYMARYDKKNGIEDIKKAKHYIEMLLELKLRGKQDADKTGR